MFSVVFSTILVVGLFIFFGLNPKIEKGEGYYGEDKIVFKWKVNKAQLLSLLGLIPLAFSLVALVPANSVGIQYNPFAGGTQEQTLGEGYTLKSPFTRIHIISTEVQTKEIEGLSVQTKDSQWIDFDIDVKYAVNESNAFEVFKQFRMLSRIDEQLVVPVAQKAIERVATQYNVMEVLGEERGDVYAKVEKELNDAFMRNGIRLVNITFVDTDAGEEIEGAIRREAAAKKQVDIAEQERLKAEKDAEAQIIRAEANKEQAILAAEAEAETIRIKQEQLAKNKDYVDLIIAEAWDGNLPQYYFGGGGGDLPSLILQGVGK